MLNQWAVSWCIVIRKIKAMVLKVSRRTLDVKGPHPNNYGPGPPAQDLKPSLNISFDATHLVDYQSIE